jgi:hypothetical protein
MALGSYGKRKTVLDFPSKKKKKPHGIRDVAHNLWDCPSSRDAWGAKGTIFGEVFTHPNILVQGMLIGVDRSGVQLAGPFDHDTYQPNRRAKRGARDGVHLQLAGSKLTGMRLLTNFLDG